jgi:hypothetical protein
MNWRIVSNNNTGPPPRAGGGVMGNNGDPPPKGGAAGLSVTTIPSPQGRARVVSNNNKHTRGGWGGVEEIKSVQKDVNPLLRLPKTV